MTLYLVLTSRRFAVCPKSMYALQWCDFATFHVFNRNKTKQNSTSVNDHVVTKCNSSRKETS